MSCREPPLAETVLYEFEPSFACVKRAMLEGSDERILIVDHSKFGRSAGGADIEAARQDRCANPRRLR
jgi:DeoR/GlpR family transcriptional regulator of sugar metabolism